MSSTGNVFPGTGANDASIGATAWTNPGNITATDASDATCNAGASSQYLVAKNFGFSIPAGAGINGITVRVNASETSAGSETLNARLQDAAGALFGTGKTASVNGTSKIVYTYGSTSDVWGATLDSTTVNDADFGVRLWYTTAHNVAIDYVTLAVEYTVGSVALTTQLVTSTAGVMPSGASRTPLGIAVTSAQQAIPSLGSATTAVLGLAITATGGLLGYTSARQIQSGQGFLTPTNPLTGLAITSGRGDVTADTGPPVGEVIDGLESAAIAQDIPGTTLFVRLHSKKPVGGSATRALVGSDTLVSAAGLFTPVPSRVPTGQVAALLGGTFGKSRFQPMTGAPLTAGQGFVAGPVGNDNWTTRSAGAVMSSRLDDVSVPLSFGTAVGFYLLNDSTVGNISRDTSIKHRTATASRRFSVGNVDGASTGVAGINYSSVRTFTQGDTMWCSLMVYAPPEMLYQAWPTGTQGPAGSETGQKLFIMSSHTGTNQVNEVVPQLNYNNNLISGYHQDGISTAVVPDIGFASNCSGSDFKSQTAIDRGANPLVGTDPETASAWSACAQDRARYGGLYSAKSLGQYQRGLGDPLSGGMRLYPNEWMCITSRLQIGTWGTNSSRWTLWAERENVPGYVTIHDEQNVKLGAGPNYDTLHILPYVTSRIPGGTHVGSRTNNITGVTILATGNGCPVGAGTLSYNATTHLFQWKGAGETFGTARGHSAANGILRINVSSTKTATTGNITGITNSGTACTANTSAAHGLVTGQSVQISLITQPGDYNYQGCYPVTVTGTNQFTYTSTLTPSGSASVGSGTWDCDTSFVVLEVAPGSLPTSGTITDTITIASGRPDTHFHYNDAIISTSAIISPNGLLPPGTDPLAVLAAGMTAGQWAQMSPTASGLSTFVGFPPDFNTAGYAGYSSKFVRDPTNKVAYMLGCDHASPSRFWTYTEATNAWSYTTALPFGFQVSGNTDHDNEHTCFDTIHNKLYHHVNTTSGIYRWDGGTTWTFISWTSAIGYNGPPTCGITFFPELGPNGSVIIYQSNGSAPQGMIVGMDPVTNAFTVYANGAALNGTPDTQVVAHYSKIKQCVVFGGGGGNNNFWRLDSNGAVTSLAPFPGTPTVNSGYPTTMMVENPLNGNFIAVSDSATWWDFNPSGSGAWSARAGTAQWISTNLPDSGSAPFGSVSCAYHDLGVIVFMKSYRPGGAAEMWVYKPAATVAPPTYTTAFPLTENPISDGGKWINGQTTGVNWQNIRTNGTSEFGVAVSAGYDDCIAVLNSSVGISSTNHYAQATCKLVGGYNPGTSHECELLTGFTISANVARGYEVTWGFGLTPQVVRWNGAISDFTVQGSSNDNVGGGKGWTNTPTGSGGSALVQGDVVKVTYAVVGGNVVLTIFKNGVQVYTVQDTSANKIVSGQPGMGNFARSGATMSSYCWSNYSAG